MKQGTGSTTHIHSCLSTSFSDHEIEVSDILLSLPYLIHESKSRHRFALSWGAKRRRSAVDLSPSLPLLLLRPSSSSPSLQRTCQVVESEKERRAAVVKVKASSPATPLSFSPSESDENSKHYRNKVSMKRTREEWLEVIDGLIQRRELLRGEIETVKGYYNKLKACNLELKAKKKKLGFCFRKPHSEISQRMVQDHHRPQIHCPVHLQPCIVDQTAYRSHTSENFQYPYAQMFPLLSSGSGLGMVKHMGPLGIPDLNEAAEETYGVMMDSPHPLDHGGVVTDNRAKAAEARRRRMARIKEMKNSSSAAAVNPPRCR